MATLDFYADRMYAAWRAFKPYDATLKQEFHGNSLSFFRAFAKDVLKINSLDYDIRSVKAGDGVSGEIILQTDSYYYHAAVVDHFAPILHRTCESRRDYIGGRNRFCTPMDLLIDPRPAFNGSTFYSINSRK